MKGRGRSFFATGGSWALSLIALLLAATVGVAAYYMRVPIDFDGPGILGLVAVVLVIGWLVHGHPGGFYL